jgi:hypothetical protein
VVNTASAPCGVATSNARSTREAPGGIGNGTAAPRVAPSGASGSTVGRSNAPTR